MNLGDFAVVMLLLMLFPLVVLAAVMSWNDFMIPKELVGYLRALPSLQFTCAPLPSTPPALGCRFEVTVVSTHLSFPSP